MQTRADPISGSMNGSGQNLVCVFQAGYRRQDGLTKQQLSREI